LGGADFAICVAVSPKAFEQAFGSLRRGGGRLTKGEIKYAKDEGPFA
jgi:hypothetical protein